MTCKEREEREKEGVGERGRKGGMEGASEVGREGGRKEGKE